MILSLAWAPATMTAPSLVNIPVMVGNQHRYAPLYPCGFTSLESQLVLQWVPELVLEHLQSQLVLVLVLELAPQLVLE